jgi:hypothetical protein
MVMDARKQDIQGWIQNAAPNFVNISFIIRSGFSRYCFKYIYSFVVLPSSSFHHGRGAEQETVTTL